MKTSTAVLAIAALLTIVTAEAAYPAPARGQRHACSVACGGGIPGKTCRDYAVSQQQCFNRCMGYQACPGVGFPKSK